MYIVKQHIGNREIQQDCYFCEQNGHYSFAIVADGLGAIPGGEKASKIIVDTSQEILQRQIISEENASSVLENIFFTSHLKIKDSRKRGDIVGNSTFAAVLCIGRIAHVLHCGDSRVYHFSGNKLIFRTKDHSFAEIKRLSYNNHIDCDLLDDASKNIVYRCLGDDDLAHGELTSFSFKAGDWFLICSDGFWGNLSFEKLSSLYDATNISAEKLLQDAFKNGQPNYDNITLILLYQDEKQSK